VWVSNPEEQVAFFGHGNNGFIIWDYHVISIEKGNPSLLFDFDVNVLSFPCKFPDYVNTALLEIKYFSEHVQLHNRFFRVVPSSVYLSQFASDRSHMIKNNEWLAKPPPYPPIAQANSKMNLHQFKNMDTKTPFIGTVMNQEEFVKFFS